MSRPIKFFFTCPKCDHEQQVGVIFGEQARTYGPPEMCDPGSSDEVDSGGMCEKCSYEFPEDELFEKAANIARERQEAYDESQYEG